MSLFKNLKYKKSLFKLVSSVDKITFWQRFGQQGGLVIFYNNSQMTSSLPNKNVLLIQEMCRPTHFRNTIYRLGINDDSSWCLLKVLLFHKPTFNAENFHQKTEKHMKRKPTPFSFSFLALAACFVQRVVVVDFTVHMHKIQNRVSCHPTN